MKLYIRYEFPCTPEELWEIFQSDEFDERLEEASNVRRELVEETTEGDLEVRTLRCITKRELPLVVAKALGNKHLVYDQIGKLDRKANVLHWQVVPTVLTDKVQARGTTTVRPIASGSERIVEGEITVAVRLIGKQIEKVIVGNVEQSFVGASDLAKKMLAERA